MFRNPKLSVLNVQHEHNPLLKPEAYSSLRVLLCVLGTIVDSDSLWRPYMLTIMIVEALLSCSGDIHQIYGMLLQITRLNVSLTE